MPSDRLDAFVVLRFSDRALVLAVPHVEDNRLFCAALESELQRFRTDEVASTEVRMALSGTGAAPE